MIRLLILLQQLVRLRRHNEIVLMQAVDRMRPPLYSDFSPLGHNLWMMVLFFGSRANFIGECNSFSKVIELKVTL